MKAMRTDIEGNVLRVVASGSMREEFNKLFPEGYVKNSKKILKVKHITDAFGRPTSDVYLEIHGFDPKSEKRTRKTKEEKIRVDLDERDHSNDQIQSMVV